MKSIILPMVVWCAAPAVVIAGAEPKPDAVRQKTAGGREVRISTYSYKEVNNEKLAVDVHRFDDDREMRPVFFHIHGGALIGGGRYVEPLIRDWILDSGFVIVSFDYRLAPWVKIPDIYQDVKDCYAWTRRHAKELFQGDADRIVAGGASAGGYLTFAAGAFLEPKPKALLSASGYGNIIAPWYAEPSDFYKNEKVYPRLDRETVYAKLKENPRDGKLRSYFYIWTRQQGVWPQVLVGLDPKKEPEKFRPFCPVYHVTKDYPPIVFTHATLDYDVPFSESEAMEAEFKKHGVPHLFLRVQGNYHAWSTIHPKVDPDGKSRKSIIEFLKGER
jgi:acetyl esterase/lipase